MPQRVSARLKSGETRGRPCRCEFIAFTVLLPDLDDRVIGNGATLVTPAGIEAANPWPRDRTGIDPRAIRGGYHPLD
jgi:hypothetical protein